MIQAVGDAALIIDDASVRLVDARGVIARWPAKSVRAHAALADPPRLALHRTDEGIIDIVDVATGAVERSIARRMVPLAFSLDGAQLLSRDASDGTARLISLGDDGSESAQLAWAFHALVVSRARHVHAGEGTGKLGHRAHVVDGERHVNLAGDRVLAFSADASLVCVSLMKLGATPHTVLVRRADASDGADVDDASSSIVLDAAPAAVWTSFDLDEIAVLDVNGRVHRRRAGAVGVRTVRGPTPHAAARSSDHARVDGPRGASVVDGTLSSDACFTPAGVCVGIRDGRALLFDTFHDGDDESDPRVVEGPTNLVLLAPHPRGVLAVDAEERAHVLAIDRDDSERDESERDDVERTDIELDDEEVSR